MASGDSKWISGEAARRDVHRWRARSGAIVTGAGTVLADDPQLTVRLDEAAEFVPPLRVVLDPGLATVARGKVREGDAPTLYVHAADAANDVATNQGLFIDGNINQLIAQAEGAGIVTVWSFAVALVLGLALKALGLFRAKKEHELDGIDVAEHKETAYDFSHSSSGGYAAAGAHVAE